MSIIRNLRLIVVLLLIASIQSSYASAKKEKPLIIPLADSPKITFSIPSGTRVKFTFQLNRYRTSYDRILGTLSLTDDGCTTGHKGTLTYRKTEKESLFVYFSKEVLWKSSAMLSISRDSKSNELTVTLNNETIKITPFSKANYLEIESSPQPINIESVIPPLD